MTLNGYFNLAWQSVTNPRDIAQLLLSIRLGSEALATAFALVVVLNGIVFAATATLTPDEAAPLALASPMVFMALQAATLAVTIATLTWTGRWLGGVGNYRDVAVLLIWLQGLRVVAQAIILALLLIAPAFGGLAVLIVTAIGVYISVNFIDEVHGLDNMFKALAALVLGVVLMAIVLSILLTIIGVAPQGVADYV